MDKAAIDVLAERQRQIDVEGWTPEHDDEHELDEIGYAASCYANPDAVSPIFPDDWPWDDNYWKPKTYRENLVRAGALILAEIERLDRS